MNLPTWYQTGLVTVDGGSTTVTGIGSLWGAGGTDDNIMIGDLLSVPSQPLVPAVVISGITADGELELMWPWPGADLTDQPYIIRYVGITERSTRANRMALELMGQISAWADIMVEDDAARLALESPSSPLRANFRVLVKNGGVIWAKATSTYGDWIGPVEFKGDQGGVGPAGPRGITPRGDYSGATAYAQHDAVLYNGSSWVALQATTGNAPPTFPATGNAYWQLLALKGTDGTGTGDVVGPAGVTADRVAVFSGVTGKLLADGGKTIAELVPAGYDDLLLSVSLIALQVADNSNVALFLGPTGNRVADSFDALTYVDVAGGTNLNSSVAGLLKPTVASLSFASVASDALASGDNGGFSGTSFRQAIASSAISGGRDLAKVRVTFAAGVSEGLNITEAFIGLQSASGDPYDADSFVSLPNSVGGLSFNIAAGATADGFADFTIPTGRGVVIAFYVSGANDTFKYALTKAGWSCYTKNSYDVAANTSGFTISSAASLAVSAVATAAIPVTNNLMVRSASFAAASVPTKMKALLLVKEVDAAIAGTDYSFRCSRDAGTTLATMTLTELYTLPSGHRVVEAAETSVASQPSGVAPRWEWKTLNNKNVELHDVYFYWS